MHLSATWEFWPFQRSYTASAREAYDLSYSGAVRPSGEQTLEVEGVQKCENTMIYKEI